MDTLLLIVVIGILITVVVTMIVKKTKKKPQPNPSPTPLPTQGPPRYTMFLNNVETVIRNNLSEDDLKGFFESVRSEVNLYKNDPGFLNDFNKLLAKYNVPYPY